MYASNASGPTPPPSLVQSRLNSSGSSNSTTASTPIMPPTSDYSTSCSSPTSTPMPPSSQKLERTQDPNQAASVTQPGRHVLLRHQHPRCSRRAASPEELGMYGVVGGRNVPDLPAASGIPTNLGGVVLNPPTGAIPHGDSFALCEYLGPWFSVCDQQSLALRCIYALAFCRSRSSLF